MSNTNAVALLTDRERSVMYGEMLKGLAPYKQMVYVVLAHAIPVSKINLQGQLEVDYTDDVRNKVAEINKAADEYARSSFPRLFTE